MRIGTDPPLPGAEVLLDGVSVGLTGADGSLTIAEVTAGSHTIEARKEGYSPDSATVSVPETTSVTLTLALITYKVVVVTILPGASIYVDGNYVGETKLGPTFIAMLTVETPPGTHEFKATRSGFRDAVRTVDVTSDMTVELIQEPLTYTVTVRVEGSGPIAGASIYFDDSYVGLTNSAGNITITDVTAGSHTIKASKSGYESASATISVPETTSVTLTLIPIAKIRTEVRLSSDKTTYTVGETAHITQGLYDEAGNLISGRVVDYTATLDGAWYAGWGQYSDDPSRTLILNKAGTYTITGEFAGDGTYGPSSKSITITATRKETRADVWVRDLIPNQTARVCVLLEELVDGTWRPLPGKTVDVTVYDPDGAWHAGWGEYTGTSWVCRGFIADRGGTWTFVVSFAGDDEYLPCSYTREVTAGAAPTYTVSVMVRYMAWPKSGASVYMDGVFKGVTDYLGKLSVPDVATGSHTFRAEWLNYWDEETITVPVNTVTLELHI